MISTKNKKGFTLIELIVVITILAILGTIAFISLNGYTSQSRDAKRSSDIKNIQSAMELKIATAGTSLTSFVANEDNKNTGMSIQGVWVTSSTEYNAGSVSFTQLNAKESEFKDPQGSSYVIGVYTKNGGAYELAASMEGDDETGKSAYVVGTYSPRGVASTDEIAITQVGSTKDYTITTAAEQGFFKKGDTLLGDATVDKVSADGKTITLTGTPTLSSGKAKLKAAETEGLIGKKGAVTTVIKNAGTDLPY